MTAATINLRESWDRLSACITPNVEGEPIVHAPAAMWHALFSDRPRPLLLPANNRNARRNGMRFFLPQLLHRCYALVRLHAHDLLGVRAQLPTVELTTQCMLSDRLAITEAPQVAFLIGTPGPYQKASMLVMSVHGEPLALVKIAMGEEANAMVESEASWLNILSGCPPIEAHVPQLLQQGKTLNGRRYFAQSIVAGRRDTGAFTAAHADFLQRLGAIDCIASTFSSAPIASHMQSNFSRLQGALTPAQSNLLQTAFDECFRMLTRWRGPFVISHGDFVAWNIRLLDDRICVFDWEYALAGMPPVFDLLHFHLISPATSGRLLTARDMRRALAHAKAFVLLSYPEDDWSESIIGGLGLAYLLHTLLFYGVSRGELVESHPVVRSYLKLVAERHTWVQ